MGLNVADTLCNQAAYCCGPNAEANLRVQFPSIKVDVAMIDQNVGTRPLFPLLLFLFWKV